MKKIAFILLVLGTCGSIAAVTKAESLGFNQTIHQCGNYRFDVTRVVDGYQIRVTDSPRLRTLFYRDVFQNVSVYTNNSSSVISGCHGDTLAIVDHAYGKYSSTATIHLIDPTGNELQTRLLATSETTTYGGPGSKTTIEPADATSTLSALLARPADPWSITRTGLVQKQRIVAEAGNMLNDRSYFMFDGNDKIIRKTAASTWNTTTAEGSIVCANGVSYVLYAKQFATTNTATSTFPASQYIIERSNHGFRTLLPVPYVDGEWRNPMKGLSPYFGQCFGENASFFAQQRVTMLTSKITFVNYTNPKTSINPSLFNDRYYTAGMIWSEADNTGSINIKGDSTIYILNSDGTVTIRKPVYFRDIRQYPASTNMQFRLNPQDQTIIDIILSQPSSDQSLQRSETYFQEHSGVYREVTSKPVDMYPLYQTEYATPLYVSADKDMLTVRSYFLQKPMLLHFLLGTPYTLLWNRIGPLEQDGTRKIWYAFKNGGTTQTWLARVR